MTPRLLFVVNDIGFFVSHRLPIGREAGARGYEVHLAAGRPTVGLPHATGRKKISLDSRYQELRARVAADGVIHLLIGNGGSILLGFSVAALALGQPGVGASSSAVLAAVALAVFGGRIGGCGGTLPNREGREAGAAVRCRRSGRAISIRDGSISWTRRKSC